MFVHCYRKNTVLIRIVAAVAAGGASLVSRGNRKRRSITVLTCSDITNSLWELYSEF